MTPGEKEAYRRNRSGGQLRPQKQNSRENSSRGGGRKPFIKPEKKKGEIPLAGDEAKTQRECGGKQSQPVLNHWQK